jgi:hypothetical protein
MSLSAPILLAALAAAPAPCDATRLETHGFSRTDLAVLDEVLPRKVPACFDEAELAEFERRLWSLGIFDDVKISCGEGALSVTVREKWTLIPSVDFSTAAAAEDRFYAVALVESNVAGRAAECGFYGAYFERALSGEVWCSQHQLMSRGFAFEMNAHHVGSGFVFDDEAFTWERRRSGGRAGIRLPFPYETAWRFSMHPQSYYERIDGDAPAEMNDHGWYGGVGLRVVRDAYEWHDLAPRGLRLGLEVTPALFFGDAERLGRHSVTAQMLAAFHFGERTGVVTNLVGEAVNPGDPNHSFLLGSISSWRGSFGTVGGLRGLPDNRNRDAWHVFSNIEFRHSLSITSRLYLQGALFTDGGVYRRMNSKGHVLDVEPGWSTGAGIRLLPTFLAGVILRLDAGRLFLPEPAWFTQFALSQYL